MELRDNIIRIACNEIGTREDPMGSNKTKYGEWFGMNGMQWCGMFVSWVYDMAGHPLGNIGYLKGFAGCETAVAHFKKTGQITDTPQPGDIVFYRFGRMWDHVGIFEGWTQGNTPIMAIEGNTGHKVSSCHRWYDKKNVIFVNVLND